jgi:hypothetical protein
VGNSGIIKEKYLFVWYMLQQDKKTVSWNNSSCDNIRYKDVYVIIYILLFLDTYTTYYKIKLLHSCLSPVKFETSLKEWKSWNNVVGACWKKTSLLSAGTIFKETYIDTYVL